VLEVTGPARSARDRRREQTRADVLAAAWSLCRERGLSGLSLRELATRVGLRAPSLYSYFDSKDAIYDAMFAQGQHDLSAALDALPAYPPGDRTDLHTCARAFFAFCTSDPVRYQLLFQRTVPGFTPSPGSYALATAHLESFTRLLTGLGMREPRHADLWTALITGLVDQQLTNEPGGDRWARLLDEAVDLFCDHAGIPPPAPTPTDQPADQPTDPGDPR
jgi:AcrR family transcriptional regulator